MKKSLLKTGFIIVLIISFEKILGFIREVLLANYFGTSEFVDSLVSASLITSVFFGWLATVSTAYTPIYKRKVLEGDSEQFTNTVKTVSYALSVFAVIVCIVFSKQLVEIALPGFSGEKAAETVSWLRIIAFTILFSYSTKINNAYIAANGYYERSVIPSVAINCVQIITLVLSLGYKKHIVALGVAVAYFTEWLISVILARKTKLRFRLSLEDRKGLKEIVISIFPITITYIIDDICTFFDKMFASFLEDGSISSLSYANSLRKVIYGMITVLISTIVYPKISEKIAQNKDGEARKQIAKTISVLLVILVPVILSFIATSTEIITIVFERGAFDAASTLMTAPSYMAYLIGIVPLSVNAVITKYFYAQKQGKVCAVLSCLTVITNIILDVVLVGKMQHTGLALATSLSVVMSMPLYLMIYFKRRNTIKETKNKNMRKIVLASILCVIVTGLVVFGKEIIAIKSSSYVIINILEVIICFIIIAAAMWLPLYILKEETVYDLLRELKKIFSTRKR